jgi:hypothetical protein
LQFGVSSFHGASKCGDDVGKRYEEVRGQDFGQSNGNMQSQKCKVYIGMKGAGVNKIPGLIQH